jgi:4'-phosphopantetheinyl transferase
VERTQGVLARWPEPLALLTSAERGRVAAFRFGQDRDDYVAAHLLVRECASPLVGVPAADVLLGQRCASCGADAHGRPFVMDMPEVGVSLSHSRGVVAAGAVVGDLGVDVEHRQERPPPDEAMLASVLTATEARVVRTAADPAATFLLLWVRKEALVKVGAMSLDEIAGVDVLGSTAGGVVDGWTMRDHVDANAVAASVHRFRPEEPRRRR